MDAQPSPHPTAETLRAYGLGKLSAVSAQIVREHLEALLRLPASGGRDAARQFR